MQPSPHLNEGRVYPEDIPAIAAGLPVLDFLTSRYGHSPRSRWASHVDAGRILLDGERATADTALREGQRLEYHRPPWVEPAAPRWLWALHRDEHLLVLCKPSGLPCLPSEMYFESTVLSMLRRRTPSAAVPIQPVHRLGVGTSGLLLCATSPMARRALSTALEERRIRKTYRALVRGVVAADQLDVDCPIGPVPHASLCGTVHGARPAGGEGAKPAVSHMRVVARDTAACGGAGASLLEVTIPTGRPHQIRIHTAFAGHPLVGDPLYAPGGLPRDSGGGGGDGTDGEREVEDEEVGVGELGEAEESGGAESFARQFGTGVCTVGRPPLPRDTGYWLHAWRIELAHPATGERVTLCAPPPAALCVAGETSLEERVARALEEQPSAVWLGDDAVEEVGNAAGPQLLEGGAGGDGGGAAAEGGQRRRRKAKGVRAEAEIAAIRAERAAKRRALAAAPKTEM